MKKLYFCLGLLVFLLTPITSLHAQAGCDDLEILTTTDGAVCGEGSATLEATASGDGDAIYWFDAAVDGNLVGEGPVFETPEIASTTSFWAAEVIADGNTYTGGGKVAPTSTSNTSGSNWGLVFDATEQFTLVDVEVFSAGSGGTLDIELQDDTGAMLESASTTVPGGGSGTSPVSHVVTLNFDVPSSGEYRLIATSAPSMIREFASENTYPYDLGPVGEVTSGYINGTSSTYYWFYNWTVSTGEIICESDRVETIATVNDVADEDIVSLPYTDTADSGNYDNNYSGAPGDDCGEIDVDYLDGHDVVYHYQPDDDYILTVELSDLGDAYTGVFIYESCDDIGDICVAEGSVSETDDDHSFQVSVLNGQDYYIVVSSAEPTESTTYTLTIDGTTCANYPEPVGDASQDFIDGQNVADLVVSGPNLTWYEDAALTTEINDPEDELLVDGTTYYVTQTFQGCEGADLAVTVNEVNCSDLDVTNVTDGEVCGDGVVLLEAEGAEPAVNTLIYWYDSETGGELLGNGTTFQTPELEETTSFWAAEVAVSGGALLSDQGMAEPNASSGPFASTLDYGVAFDVFQEFTLASVDVYPSGSAGDFDIELWENGNQTLIYSETISLPSGDGTVPFTIELGVTLSPGTNYRLIKNDVAPAISLIRNSTGAGAPHPIGVTGEFGEVVGGISSLTATASTATNYWFYNFTIGSVDVLCESTRSEVVATVNEVADEIASEPLPYVHTANTQDYGNNYSGEPGSDCNASGEALNGNDVVYQYSPSVGGVYSIELSGLSSDNAAVFVYTSCYNIGEECYAGAESDGSTADFGIDEVSMYDGNDYFIVISTSESTSTDYTITIDEAVIDCNDYTAAPEGDEEQFFEPAETLADLEVNGGNLTWYDDAAGTSADEIPETTAMVDGETYWVRQTLNGCDSDLLGITVTEVNCDDLEVVSSEGDTIICKGYATLEATGNGGVGTEIYWYDAEIDGEFLGAGSTYETEELTATTSYWAAEVLIDGSGPISGQAKPAPVETANTTLSNYGLQFEATQAFTLMSVDVYPNTSGGSVTVELREDDGTTVIESVTENVPGGDLTTPYTIDLNFEIEPGNYRLMRTGTTSLVREFSSAGNVFPYDISTVGQVNGGVFGTGAPNTTYYFFYNWTIGMGEVLCESPREEVIAEVTTDGDEVVTALPYTHTENTATYGNNFSGAPGTDCGTDENYLNGNDVVYQFTAPADDILTIELADISGFYGGVFVYETCSDIAEQCVAGEVAGPNDDDFAIEEFYVEAGDEYYIVVSSWLTSDIDYTLNIFGFDCSTFEAPEGEAEQSFVAGDVVDDLEVEGTMSGVDFTWYEDAALANEITDPTTELLVDGETYYVTQTLQINNCESAALAITVDEIDCGGLEIVDTTEDSVVCLGEMTLEAVASGTGSEIYWYDAETGGELLGTGSSFDTPVLTTTTSYWAAEVFIEGEAPLSGQAKPAPIDTANTTLSNYGLQFEATESFTLTSVEVYPNTTGGDVTIELREDDGVTVLASETVTVPGGDLTTPHTVNLNFAITPGTYRLMKTGSTSLVREFAFAGGNSFPYPIGDVGEVNGGVFGTGAPNTTYYFFYNWTIGTGEVVCESDREEVVAEVTGDGDITVSGGLPYSDSDNTASYGNNFSGAPGCASSDDYLDGDDVVYQYTPANDDIVTIELENVTNEDTGMFVYESCGDIGDECIAGVIEPNAQGQYLISDFFLTGGQSYYIVVSSISGGTNYTLNIYGYDCAEDLEAPVGESEQYFIPGTDDELQFLNVEEYQFSTGLTWYDDEALTNEIPETTTLVDGETYYVTQDVLDCESDALEITVFEFECSSLEVLSTTDDIVCESGMVTLTAEGASSGSEIHWYDAETGGTLIGVGEELATNISATTSFWAEQVYIQGETSLSGQAKPAPIATENTTLSNYGLQFEATDTFTLISVDVYPGTSGGDVTVELREDDGTTVLQSTTVTVPGGDLSTPHTISLGFTIPSPGTYRLMKTGSTTLVREFAAAGGNSFPYDLGTSGEVTGGVFGTGAPNTTYYFFYNWTISTGDVLCSSDRMEAIGEVNNTIPDAPQGDALQEVCENATIEDLDVTGDNLQWFDDAGELLEAGAVLQDGETYFVTQTVDACESDALEVTVNLIDNADMPLGATNQSFVEGETLADLEVNGENLTWYADEEGAEEIPETTALVDQTSYYVTQTTGDLCESDLMRVTVHEVLTVDEPVFESLVYYPNPAEDELTVTNENTAIEKIEVYNLIGQQVISKQIGTTSATLDVSHLASGAYLMQVTIEDKTGMYKIIKK